MPEDITPHQLTKQIPGTTITITVAEGSGFLETVSPDYGWEGFAQGIGSGAVVYRTYIDLAGWTQEELTTFVQGVDIQKMRTPLGSTTGGNPDFPLVWEYDLLTTRKIQLEELVLFPNVPGFFGGTLDLMENVYGQSRTYAVNTQVASSYITTDTGTFGTGDAVATDKLHWTRFIVFSTAGQEGDLELYPTNLIVNAVTAKEKDLVWMERLRRSYVLQGGAD